MVDFFLNDLGIICLAFWGIFGFLLFWYLYKIKPINNDSRDLQKCNEEDTNTKNALLESLQDEEELNRQEDVDLNNPEQPRLRIIREKANENMATHSPTSRKVFADK